MRHATILVLILLTLSASVQAVPQDLVKKSALESPSLWVQVALKNGSQIVGIAKQGVLLERRVRGEFRLTRNKLLRNAGIRVWSVRSKGFMFLTYSTVDTVKILSKVQPEEMKRLEEAIRRAKQGKPVVKIESVPADPSKDSGDGDPAGQSKKGDQPSTKDHVLAPDVGKDGLTAAERKLLKRFDPAKGWSPERYGEIQRRRILEKRNPTRKEEDFCDAFTDWERAIKNLHDSKLKSGKNRRANR